MQAILDSDMEIDWHSAVSPARTEINFILFMSQRVVFAPTDITSVMLEQEIKRLRFCREEPPRKVLVAPLTQSLACLQIVQAIRNDHMYIEQADKIVAVTSGSIPGIVCLAYQGNEQLLLRLVQQADLVILDLVRGGPEISAILYALLASEKLAVRLICLSTVYTWALTRPAAPSRRQLSKDINRTVNTELDVDQINSRRYTIHKSVLNAKLYKHRQSILEYNYAYYSEQLALRVAARGLRVNILSCGLIYGKGEQDLCQLFEQAFQNKPIQCLQEAKDDWVPMISVGELVNQVKSLIECPSTELFQFASEGCKMQTLEEILSAVSECVQGRPILIQQANHLREAKSIWYFPKISLAIQPPIEAVIYDQFPKPCFLDSIQEVVEQYRVLRPRIKYSVIAVNYESQFESYFLEKCPGAQIIPFSKVLQPAEPELAQRLKIQREQLQRQKLLLQENLKKKKSKQSQPVRKQSLSLNLIERLLVEALNGKKARNKGFVLLNCKFTWARVLQTMPQLRPTEVIYFDPVKLKFETKLEQKEQHQEQSFQVWQKQFPGQIRKFLRSEEKGEKGEKAEKGGNPNKGKKRLGSEDIREESAHDKENSKVQQFIIDNVLPGLTECFIELCRKKTDQPVQTLVKLLRARANRYRIADPFEP